MKDTEWTIYSSMMGTVSGEILTLDKDYDLYYKNSTPQEYFETTLNHFGKYMTTGVWLVPSKLIKSCYAWDNKAGLNDGGCIL